MTVVEEVMPENEESAIYPQKPSDSKKSGNKKNLAEGLAKLCPSTGTKNNSGAAQSETDVDEDNHGVFVEEEEEENKQEEDEEEDDDYIAVGHDDDQAEDQSMQMESVRQSQQF